MASRDFESTIASFRSQWKLVEKAFENNTPHCCYNQARKELHFYQGICLQQLLVVLQSFQIFVDILQSLIKKLPI